MNWRPGILRQPRSTLDSPLCVGLLMRRPTMDGSIPTLLQASAE
jgi:hypothetical protein